jgi:hypothetical protein
LVHVHTGDIFRMYFRNLGEPNAAGEIPVLCPFPHKRKLESGEEQEYFETVPSAHVHLGKGVFHCKVCRALGRFNDGGMSEVDFYAKVNGIAYWEALLMLDMLGKSKKHQWQNNVQNLLSSEKWMRVVKEQLCLTEELVHQLQLGFAGDGIQFPVFIHGELLDIRTYDPDGKPKVVGQKGSKPLIFPFDLWVDDDRPTLLCEGEKDAAIARLYGFNSITITGGAGTFPKILRNYFKGRDVYIVYDCDDAGRSGAEVVAYNLQGIANTVRIVDLQLGDKEDLHDFFIKYRRSANDLERLMQQSKLFSPEDYRAVKDKIHPLVDLWDAPKGKYAGKEISSRVIMSGRFDAPMETPSVVEWMCTGYNPEKEPCLSCPFYRKHGDDPYYWILTEENSDQLLKLVDSGLKEAQVNKNLRQFVGIPDDCPGHSKAIRAKKAVSKVVLVPDVEGIIKDDPMSDFKSMELVAYILEQDNGIDVVDGQRYRMNYKRYPHPLQGQRIVAVVHHVEPSDNPVNTFRITPEVRDGLKVFQGDPKEKMRELAEMARAIVGPHILPMLTWSVDLIFHSPLQFYFGGKLIKKGYPEGTIIGESRTGKTDIAHSLISWYGIGTYTDVKNASVAGLIGGADKLPNGGFKLSWGTIPLNNKGLVVLDEYSGMPTEVMAKLTSLRSSSVARIEKIGSAKGAAPAYTRLLWITNQRVQSNKQTRPLHMYPSGIDVLLELFGSAEDIARFDFAYMIGEPEEYTSPLETVDIEPYPQELYRQLVYWAWSRKPEQIVFDEGVEQLIVERGKLLNAKYKSNIKIFGPEAWKKIARLAVATACRLFSCDDTGERVVVSESHVNFACRFLVDCYDNDLFRLKRFVETQKMYTETDENVNKVVAGLMRQYPAIIRFLDTVMETSPRHIQTISGLDKQQFDMVMNRLHEYFLIEWTGDKVMPSYRFRKAVDAAKALHQKTYLQPLSTGG